MLQARQVKGENAGAGIPSSNRRKGLGRTMEARQNAGNVVTEKQRRPVSASRHAQTAQTSSME